jgi:CDP-diacylglycerol--serine O-phosphatidyltransferase
MFNWALVHVGKFGWSASFLYCACAALRLARFNTQVDTADKRYFTGLASPAAAAVIAGTVWLGSNMQVQAGMVPVLLALLTAATGLLMVTNLRYYSFKGIDFRGRVPFVYLLAVLMIITVLVWHTELAVLSIAVLYALSGPLLHWRTRKASS